MNGYVNVENGGWFKRFQDTPSFDAEYHSTHTIFDPEKNNLVNDSRLNELDVYSDEQGELKVGYVFAYRSGAETDEEFLEEACEGGTGQECDCSYCVFFDTDWNVNLDDMGHIIDLKRCKIVKVVKVVDVEKGVILT